MTGKSTWEHSAQERGCSSPPCACTFPYVLSLAVVAGATEMWVGDAKCLAFGVRGSHNCFFGKIAWWNVWRQTREMRCICHIGPLKLKTLFEGGKQERCLHVRWGQHWR